jgi:NTE family protein
MNQVFFATSGTFLNLRASRSLTNHFNATYIEFPEDNASGSLNGSSKVSFQFEKRMPITRKTSLIAGLSSGLLFMDQLDSDDFSLIDYGLPAKYTLGGNLISPVENTFVFQGLNETDLIVTQFVKATVGAQINPFNKIYITPYVNLASVGFNDFDNYIDSVFSSKGKWINTTETSFLFSGGTTISYSSILGPVNFDMAYLNNVDQLKIFFSVGLRFNIPY